MAALTVAEVAGIVAFATAVVAFLGPNLIALLIASRVGHKRSAAAWSVIGRELQSSNWPLLLRTDTSASKDIPWSICVFCWLQKLALVFVTVAGIVTPLGLGIEVRLDTKSRPVDFLAVQDAGPIGKGTPPRDLDAFFNRICFRTWEVAIILVDVACPFSNMQGKIKVTANETAISWGWNGTYDNRIPYETAEIFTSLHDDHPQSVSGAFDVQWRQYTYETWNDPKQPTFNHGKPWQVGLYRPLDSMILDDVAEPVDGLVVDTRDGGIALRNHTAPTETELGGKWTEDLLFITPRTECVDTNLTLDFQIAPVGYSETYFPGSVTNLALTDRGGFLNLNLTLPEVEGGDSFQPYHGQHELNLRFRAYKGAWFNNVKSMFYFNVSNPQAGDFEHDFTYLDSHVGKKFYLDPYAFSASTNALQLSLRYGAYISEDGYYEAETGKWTRYEPFNETLANALDPRTVYRNPFHIASENFTSANIVCSGTGNGDKANITNVGVACGLMFGAATRADGQQSLILTPGSLWRQPIYSCATPRLSKSSYGLEI